jgi:hypothetical protein
LNGGTATEFDFNLYVDTASDGLWMDFNCGLAAYCGDGTCDDDENHESCPNDCYEEPYDEYCGDGVCNGFENCTSCSQDCGACGYGPYCGDGSCNGSESCSSCSGDCGECGGEESGEGGEGQHGGERQEQEEQEEQEESEEEEEVITLSCVQDSNPCTRAYLLDEECVSENVPGSCYLNGEKGNCSLGECVLGTVALDEEGTLEETPAGPAGFFGLGKAFELPGLVSFFLMIFIYIGYRVIGGAFVRGSF